MQSTLRKLQDEMANAGWRIKQISHAPDDKPVVVRCENWAGYVAVISIIGFPIGCGIAIYQKEHGQSPFTGLCIAIASWAISLLALAVKNKIRKRNWIFIPAKCLEREVRRVAVKGRSAWASRILCQFEHEGTVIQCTPVIHWRTFYSESDAHEFLNSRIDPGGGCTLSVNPRNLRETHLVPRPLR